MSAFRKYNVSSLKGDIGSKHSLPGTKSWLYGQSLISTGCSDLNNACGSGIPLGSMMILSEDSFIHQGKYIMKLIAAEGIQSKQKVLLISSLDEEEIREWCSKLPTVRTTSQPTTVAKKEMPQRSMSGLGGQYSKYLLQSKSSYNAGFVMVR